MNNKEWLERLAHDAPDELAAWFDAEHAEPNDGNGPESVVRADSVDANDSREKLEDDVGFIVKEGFVTYKSIIGWLDRQAAITANETNYNNPYVGLVRGKQWERTEISDYYCGRCGWKVTDHDSYCPECGGALHKASNKPDGKFDARKTAETAETCATKEHIRDFDDTCEQLEADVRDQIVDGIAKLMQLKQSYTFDPDKPLENIETIGRYIDELQAKVDKLTANANDLWGRTRDELAAVKRERDNLADDLLASNREREGLRRTLGIALDHAHDMLALVNLDGEVVS